MSKKIVYAFLLLVISTCTLRGQQISGHSEDILPVRAVFHQALDRDSCFIVISKVHQEHLSVYERRGNDIILLAWYPVCLGRNLGQKHSVGDMTTPESYPGEPFLITMIEDSSKWEHDFGDGRGSILAYGKWFFRLSVQGFTGIGIHGSTNNRESIGVGRGSEGCIRMLDEDIIHLHDCYACKGMQVTVLPEGMGPLPFEVSAFAAEGIFLNSKEGDQYIRW